MAYEPDLCSVPHVSSLPQRSLDLFMPLTRLWLCTPIQMYYSFENSQRNYITSGRTLIVPPINRTLSRAGGQLCCDYVVAEWWSSPENSNIYLKSNAWSPHVSSDFSTCHRTSIRHLLIYTMRYAVTIVLLQRRSIEASSWRSVAVRVIVKASKASYMCHLGRFHTP